MPGLGVVTESPPEPPSTDLRYIACIVSYDGTDWSGFQRQKNGPSVQGEIERALEVVMKEPSPIVAAGRTDAGGSRDRPGVPV